MNQNKVICKLTTQDMTTHGDCKWTVGEWKETSGKGNLCGPGWLHYYHHPLLAVLLNPIHAEIDNPRLWAIEIDGDTKDDRGLKSGATRMRLIEDLPLPELTDIQRIAFGILCAKEVCDEPDWNEWADKWLSGEDRSGEAARAAWDAAGAAARAAWAAWDAAGAAARAAWAAAWAAEAAAEAARAAWAAAGAGAAAESKPINLIEIAIKASTWK